MSNVRLSPAALIAGITLLVTTPASAGGWYLATPPDGGMTDTPARRGWHVRQPFETLADCKREQRRETTDAISQLRRTARALDEEHQLALRAFLNPDTAEDIRQQAGKFLFKDRTNAATQDVLAGLAAYRMANASQCVASDDVRLR